MKVILLGDSGVGKTSLMHRYVNQKFSQSYQSTIGVDFLSKDIMVDNSLCVMQIWDTAGQERFKSLSNAFFRGADAIALVFDLTRRETFDHLQSWLDLFYETVREDEKPPIVVLGNKCDRVESTVTPWEARNWAYNHQADYFEVSAKTDVSVGEAFMTIAKKGPRDKSNDVSESIPDLLPMIHEKRQCCR